MQPKPQQPPRQLRFELPANMNATYANAVMISQTHSEIVMDFIQVMPNSPVARVQSRVVMTPSNAKAFLQALSTNLDRFEEKHGPISMPPQPPTLADQLFGTVRPENDADADIQDKPENG
jgi:hypothetical protein